MRAYELPWYKILFSGINWHRYEVYSNQNFSSFSLRKSFVHSCTVFRKLRRPKSYRRSSLLQIFYKIGALKSHAKLTEKHICLRFIFIKVAVWRAATLSKNKLWHSYFPKNFAKFLRAPPVKNTSGQLLLSASITWNAKLLNFSSNFPDFLLTDLLVQLTYAFLLLVKSLQSYKYILTVSQFVDWIIRHQAFWISPSTVSYITKSKI